MPAEALITEPMPFAELMPIDVAELMPTDVAELMPTDVADLLANWEIALPPRVCECGALVPRACPGEPCDECKDVLLAPNCRACGDIGRVRRDGHWADDMMGWTPCPECGDWGDAR